MCDKIKGPLADTWQWSIPVNVYLRGRHLFTLSKAISGGNMSWWLKIFSGIHSLISNVFFRHSDIMERSFFSFLGKTTAACLYGFFSFLPWRRCPTYWYLSCSPEKYLPVHVNCAFKRKRVRFATALSKVIIFFMFHVMMHHIFKKRMLTCQPN